MFGLFNRKKRQELLDLDGNPLHEGDVVDNFRYDMGECRLVNTGDGLAYESLADGRRVSWLRMIDAATERQKVRLKQD